MFNSFVASLSSSFSSVTFTPFTSTSVLLLSLLLLLMLLVLMVSMVVVLIFLSAVVSAFDGAVAAFPTTLPKLTLTTLFPTLLSGAVIAVGVAVGLGLRSV